MNKKELTESIEEGLTNVIDKILNSIFYGILIVIIILLIFFVVTKIKDNKFEKDFCGEEGCPEPQIAKPLKDCQIGEIYCAITTNDDFYFENILESESLCGYGEANEWFNQMKQNIQIKEDLKSRINKTLIIDCYG